MAVQPAPGYLDAIASVTAFRDLPEAALEALSGISSMRHYRKDTYIFIEGEESEFLCFVHQGAVRAFRTSALGTEQTLRILRPGELFSLTGFLDRRMAYTATTQTLEETWVGFIRNDALRALCQRRADIGWRLMQVIGRRLAESQSHIVELSSRDASGKLAAALLRLGDDSGERHGNTVHVALRMTHRELAQLIGCSRETVTRVMREFRDDRSVELGPQGHLIIHPNRLSTYVG